MLTVLVVLLLASPTGGVGGVSAQAGMPNDETPRLWFVELSGAPTADGNDEGTVRREQDDFRSQARGAGVRFTERRSFGKLFNGLSVEVDPANLAALRRLPSVKALYPIETVALPPTPPQNVPELSTALAMTGADVAQSELGFTGKGIRVAVMDTGVDYNNPDLGGCFGPGCRVAFGYDLVGDAFNADQTSPAYNPVATPDNDPDDCSNGVGGGHGTHVAGIVGANGKLKGVAPEATLGAYRVFGCEGSTTSDIMVAAMERVLDDDMQVLNMSIGSSFQWPQYPTAMAADRLVKKGVVVVASIGNSGANGLYAAGAPGVGSRVIGVASFDNTAVTLPVFTVSPDNKAIGYGAATGAPAPPTSGSLPLARTGTAATTNDACAALPAGSLADKAALIRRGTCSFYQKAINAQNAGAKAVVIYNNAPGRLSPTVTPPAAGAPPITIPVVMISADEGVLIDSRLAAGPVTLTWTAQSGSFRNPTGGLLSSFSSYGLAADLSLKPDLGAPGGQIYSTYPLEKGGYASLNGTSMSSPHVAGAVALLLQARPRTQPEAVHDILLNTAEPAPFSGGASLGLEHVHRQGAGMLQIDRAILSTTRVEPSQIALGESADGPVTRRLTIENDGPNDVTYTLGHAPALSTLPGAFAPKPTNGYAAVTFSQSSVTVRAGKTERVNVTIAANPALANGSIYGGYIELKPQGVGQAYRVPYAGFKGDYQAVKVLTSGNDGTTDYGFPWLAKRTATGYAKQAAGTTFTLQNGDIPYVLLHFDHQVRRLRIEVRDVATGQLVRGEVFEDEYLPRNSTAIGFFAYAFGGTTTEGKRRENVVPDGQYVLVVTVDKALGERKNPAHVETWTSPAFTIDRP
jgi:subtilisin family serine protease